MLKKVVSIIILIILLPILFINGVILVNSYIHPDEVPSFFGWKPFIVLSGSMETEIYPGDIAVTKEEGNFQKGDIIAFKENNIVITHRIVEVINEDGNIKYITKGDNNNAEDRGFVLPEQVEGVFKFRIPRLGNFAIFIQTPTGIIACLSIPLLALIIIQLIESKKDKKYLKNKSNEEKILKEEIERLKKEKEELMKK